MAEYEDNTKKLPLGSCVLVKLNYCDEEGDVVEEKQFHGLIDRITTEEVVIKNPNNGKEVSLPPLFGSYVKAEKGKYDLPSTGEFVIDPDFITEWTLRASSAK
jgi:hypothetical protein